MTIGKYAFDGAGAVVTKDIPGYALAVGNPARISGWRCECGEKITFPNEEAECAACKMKYIKKSEYKIDRDNTNQA